MKDIGNYKMRKVKVKEQAIYIVENRGVKKSVVNDS